MVSKIQRALRSGCCFRPGGTMCWRVMWRRYPWTVAVSNRLAATASGYIYPNQWEPRTCSQALRAVSTPSCSKLPVLQPRSPRPGPTAFTLHTAHGSLCGCPKWRVVSSSWCLRMEGCLPHFPCRLLLAEEAERWMRRSGPSGKEDHPILAFRRAVAGGPALWLFTFKVNQGKLPPQQAH